MIHKIIQAKLKFHLGLWLLICLISLPLSHAKVEAVEFEDPGQQKLYLQLIKELRCLVCQNQNLADSNADLAIDLRRKTRELVAAGKSRQDVVDYMVKRYGEFVLYRPAFNAANLFLWISPLILLLLTIGLVIRSRRRQQPAAETFTAEQHAQARALMETEQGSDPAAQDQH